MAIGDIIVGIDIGTSKVCTVVGEVNNFGQIETICSTSERCSGLKKGKIISEEEISLSIAKTIKDAEEEAEFKINSAYVTIPGKYVTIVQNSILKELKGEKVDLVLYSEDPAEFIKNAMTPAKDVIVSIPDAEERNALVIVNNDNLSQAIGKKGSNIKLASKLTKYHLEIKTMEEIQQAGNN